MLGGITSIALLSDGSAFYIGTTLSNMYRVDYAALAPKLEWSCHHQRINDVCFPVYAFALRAFKFWLFSLIACLSDLVSA